MAEMAAIADGVSTYALIRKGGKELNPLMPSSKKGVIVATVAKVGILAAVDAFASPDNRDMVMAAASGAFTGAAISNALQQGGTGKTISITAGIAAGVGAFFLNQHLSEKHRVSIGVNSIQYERKF